VCERENGRKRMGGERERERERERMRESDTSVVSFKPESTFALHFLIFHAI
jgi:hypothetical protein